jgi:hypothetical protein
MMDFDLTENDVSVIMEIVASLPPAGCYTAPVPEPVRTLPETDAPWSPPTRFIKRGRRAAPMDVD